MTDKELNQILNKLNKNIVKAKELIFIRPLSSTVEFAKYFEKKPSLRASLDFDSNPYKFYLIKNEEGFYIGIVLDRTHDLHWYIKRPFRGKGYLTRAMKETILTHLFNFNSRDEQEATISEKRIGAKLFKASEKVGLSIGFKFQKSDGDKCFYLLKREEHVTTKEIEGENTIIPEERINKLKHTFFFLAHSLKMIETEIEMHTGKTDYFEDLEFLSDELKKNARIFEEKCNNANLFLNNLKLHNTSSITP